MRAPHGSPRAASIETAALRAWAQRLMVRRGKRVAVVALARRLAGILFAMWRDGVPYDARKIRGLRVAVSEAPAHAG